jgi:hypothetical protein
MKTHRNLGFIIPPLHYAALAGMPQIGEPI